MRVWWVVLAGCSGMLVDAPPPLDPPLPSTNPPIAAAHDAVLEAAVQRQLGPKLLHDYGMAIGEVVLLDGDWSKTDFDRRRPVAMHAQDAAGRCHYLYGILVQKRDGAGYSALVALRQPPKAAPCRP
jgi:hypothetical protein